MSKSTWLVEPRALATTDDAQTRCRVFWRLWGLAVLVHVLAYPHSASDGGPHGVLSMAMGWGAIVVLVVPTTRVGRVLLLVSVLVTAWFEAPAVGNHWVLAAFISLAALGSRPWEDDEGWWHRFAPTARAALLTAYSWAAFAKLNTGFLDPETSCAVVYASQSLRAIGLGPIRGAAAHVLPFLVLAIELAVPMLLLGRRTRAVGIALAITFHVLISWDLDQHFYDFTAVLAALFTLFAGAERVSLLDDLLHRPAVRWPTVVRTLLALMAVAVLVSGVTPSWQMRQLTVRLAFLIWVPISLLLIVWSFRQARFPGVPLRLAPRAAAGVALVAVVALNGAAPYLGLKSGYAFNMYANMRIVPGGSNHLVVPERWAVGSAYDDFVVVTSTDDPQLLPYVSEQLLVPARSLGDYLSEHPTTTVTAERQGHRVDLASEPAGSPSLISKLRRKVLPVRSVSSGDQQPCRTHILRAG